MKNTEDQASGRPIIEGKGSPIDGGVYRRPNYPGIVVDLNSFNSFDWFPKILEIVMKTKINLMDTVTTVAKEYMPINPKSDREFMQQFGKVNRYNLSSFAVTRDEKASGISKSTSDAQALFVALLLETRIREEKGDRRVAIIKDPTDGHAVVYFQRTNTDVLKFDPKARDGKFVNLSKPKQ